MDAERRSRLMTLGRESRALVLRALRDHGPLARHQLAEQTALSRAAANGIVDALLSDGRLVEPQGDRQRGVPVALNPGYATVVGLEVTNDGRVHTVVVDATGAVGETGEQRFDPHDSPERISAALAAIARDALPSSGRAAGGAAGTRRAVAIAVPGTVDLRAGVARWLPFAHNWFDVPLRSLVGDALGLPVLVDWRAYTTTIAELRFGAAHTTTASAEDRRGGRDSGDVLCLYLGEGIGMGIGRGGEIVRGAGHQAGSVAHLQVLEEAPDTPVCHCGMRGCLWSVASVPALLRRVERAVGDGALSRIADEKVVDLGSVVDAARQGDRLCSDVLRDVALATGRALAASVHVLNPHRVVVSGPLAAAADLLAPLVAAELERRTFPWLSPKPTLSFSTLGTHGAARGAAAMMTDVLLEITEAS